MAKLILWDIDGTLLSTQGAGMRAMKRAAAATFGDVLTFDGIEVAGNLDPLILAAAAEGCGVALSQDHHGRFMETYCRLLPEELAASGKGLRVMPGVLDVLAAMRADDRLTLGLLTGNYRATARLKLAAGGIEPDWFPIGAFGDDAADRPSLVPVAMRRYEAMHGRPVAEEQVALIGDTPRDVHAAKTHGCHAVAVATGPYTAADLQAAGADLVLEDMTDPRPLMNLLT